MDWTASKYRLLGLALVCIMHAKLGVSHRRQGVVAERNPLNHRTKRTRHSDKTRVGALGSGHDPRRGDCYKPFGNGTHFLCSPLLRGNLGEKF
jgi:hypothetical protein